LLVTVTTGFVGSLAGCTWDPSFSDADVIAGPDGQLVFEPAELTVAVGGTVAWGFPTSGHNVACRPNDSDEVRLPDDAEPFASYGPDESPRRSLVPRGETYEYTFHEKGTYEYVCIPHVNQGMKGTIHIE
jgi:plastocyanin